MSISELENISGISKRNIKYYITKGVIPPAIGKGKAARYSLEHLEALRNIQNLQKEGYSLSRIQELRVKTDQSLVNARPNGVAVTRTEIGIMEGVFVSFIHEMCRLKPEEMTRIVEKVAELINRELAESEKKDDCPQ